MRVRRIAVGLTSHAAFLPFPGKCIIASPERQHRAALHRAALRIGPLASSCERRIIAVFSFYADASGTDAANRVLAVSGYIAPDVIWHKIEREWHLALAGTGIDYIHMKSFGTPHCKFGTGKWNNAKKNALLIRLVNILNTWAHRSTSIAVHKIAYTQRVKELETADVIGPEYSGCAQSMLGYVELWAQERSYAGPLSYVFEDGDRKHELLHAYGEIRKQWKQITGSENRTISFLGKGSPALQAADILAYETTDIFSRALSKHGTLRGPLNLQGTPVEIFADLFNPIQAELFGPHSVPFHCAILNEKFWSKLDSSLSGTETINPGLLKKRRKRASNQGKRNRR